MKRPVAISLLLVLATLAVYAQTLSFDYVELDDPDYVRDKAEVSGSIDAADVVWAFTTTDLANWHPLTWLSHMTDVALFGKQSPGAQHGVNVIA